jgi:hypothetical protein
MVKGCKARFAKSEYQIPCQFPTSNRDKIQTAKHRRTWRYFWSGESFAADEHYGFAATRSLCNATLAIRYAPDDNLTVGLQRGMASKLLMISFVALLIDLGSNAGACLPTAPKGNQMF